MADFRLSQTAEAELDAILDWSEIKFHEAGRIRYATLLVQAMQDIACDPQREGVEWVRALGLRIGLYHVWHSRNSVSDPAERVNGPRHLFIFRISDDGVIDILGFAHDNMLRSRALRRVVRANVPGFSGSKYG